MTMDKPLPRGDQLVGVVIDDFMTLSKVDSGFAANDVSSSDCSFKSTIYSPGAASADVMKGSIKM